jgi:mRNA interferase MazF
MPTRTSIHRPIVRGDIVLVPFPFTDLSTTKRRPAVVVGIDPVQADLTLAFVTTQDVGHLDLGEVAVLPTHPEYGLSGLRAPSKIRLTKLVTLARGLLRRWLGRLGPLLTTDLDRALITALSINVVPYGEDGRLAERQRLSALHRTGGSAALLADLELHRG